MLSILTVILFRQAKEQAQVQFLVGFEVEFILLKSTNPVEPLDRHHWTSSDGLRSGSIASQILREIADCLRSADIGLTMYHAEAAPGQVCDLLISLTSPNKSSV